MEAFIQAIGCEIEQPTKTLRAGWRIQEAPSCHTNFAILAEEIGLRLASYQNGSPTTIIGPPSTR